jgi:aminoglycoside phosphotransferase (APT) family kinase protein
MHADIHPGNIIMSAGSADVLAIVDWHEVGWCPDFWEYIRAFWTVDWKVKDDWKDHIGMLFSLLTRMNFWRSISTTRLGVLSDPLVFSN